jgi:hypothetical protein
MQDQQLVQKSGLVKQVDLHQRCIEEKLALLNLAYNY